MADSHERSWLQGMEGGSAFRASPRPSSEAGPSRKCTARQSKMELNKAKAGLPFAPVHFAANFSALCSSNLPRISPARLLEARSWCVVLACLLKQDQPELPQSHCILRDVFVVLNARTVLKGVLQQAEEGGHPKVTLQKP